MLVDDGLQQPGVDSLGVVGGMGEHVDSAVHRNEHACEIGGMSEGKLAVAVSDLDRGAGVGLRHRQYLAMRTQDPVKSLSTSAPSAMLRSSSFEASSGVAGWGISLRMNHGVVSFR